jgi:hypothetical protein
MRIDTNLSLGNLELNQKKEVKKENVINGVKKEDEKSKIEPLNIEATEKKKKGVVAQKLEELNKSKVTVKALEDTVNDIKKEKKKDKPDIIDPKDTNKDGKVSIEEQQKAKEKKTISLVKEIVSELKKETKDIDEKDFKNISKMINTDIIKSNESPKLNSFLDNQ